MASSPSTRSMRSMTVAELFHHFRSSINRGALQALEERDADFCGEIEALRARCRSKDAESAELLRRITCLEEELSEQTSARMSLEENGARLQLEKDELARVCAEKADSEAMSEKNDQIEKKPLIEEVCDVKMALEAENVRLKGLEKELNLKIGVLEKEKGEIEALKDEVKALKDESIELVHNIDVLKRQKRDMEIEFSKKESAKSAEFDMVLTEKRTLEVLKEGMKEIISKLAAKNKVLEMEKTEIEAELCQTLHDKDVLEGLRSRMEAELKEKISQLVNEVVVLEKERGEKEAEFLKADKEKSTELERMNKERMALEVQKRRAEESVKVLEKAKTALEDDFYGYRKETRVAMEEKNKLIKKITQEKMALKAELRKAVEDGDSKWRKRTEVLVRQKDDMAAEIRKAKKQTINDSENISTLIEALEDQKTQNENAEKHMSKILKTVGVLEGEKEALDAKERERGEEINSILKEKRIMEDEHKQKVSELVGMIEVLKREKMEMGAKFCQANRESCKEIKRILKEKMSLEAETRTLEEEDHKKILELKKKKVELKAKICEANKEKDEEINRILDENVAIKPEERSLMEEGAKKIKELVGRIGILEREKRKLDEEILQKDEVIQVLVQENESLEDTNKKLKTEINGLASKLKKTVNSVQPVHHPSNADMLRTPLKNEGQKSLGKRKRRSSEDLSGGRISDVGNPSSHVSENVASCRRRKHTTWETDQDLLDAFDCDPELCLEAICAIYRQHKSSLPSSEPTNSPPSHGVRGLEPDCSAKVIALAEYLIDEDPEGRMQRSVAELEQLDNAAVGECIAIAKQHYKQVFQIYKNKEDPFFLS